MWRYEDAQEGDICYSCGRRHKVKEKLINFLTYLYCIECWKGKVRETNDQIQGGN